ncbi:hypothetical protein V8B97DRAFT_2011766 [Scleroderma yunnanense]
MSSDSTNPIPNTSSPPQHRLHNPNESVLSSPPIEGGRAGGDADRSPHSSYTPSEGQSQFSPTHPGAVDTLGDVCDTSNDHARGRGSVPGIGNTPPIQDTELGTGTKGRSAFTSTRPLGVAPVPEGGVAIGGQPGLPPAHAGLGDKIIGKTEKVIGKVTNNAELHEQGELRETGGKAAAEGRARAAHD